jgi:hypothetical protein
VELLIVPFWVKEVNCATAGPNYRAFVIMAFSLKELQGFVESFWSYLKGLVRNAVLLKSVAVEWARTLKKHHIRIAAREPY